METRREADMSLLLKDNLLAVESPVAAQVHTQESTLYILLTIIMA